MKYFEHSRAANFAEAVKTLKAEQGSVPIAGGTDLLSVIKTEILESSPTMVVDIKAIPGADEIAEKDGALVIGANAKLSAIAQSDMVTATVPALAQAAYSVATPLIRNLATLGGNLCQDVRCWFYRYPHEVGDRIVCRRKGGDNCFAILGDNRYHSIFGGMRCGANPCTQGCPAATAIPDYLEQLRLGNTSGAAQILFEVNPMPVITSRVCAHFCQDNCNKSETGESVAIRNIERYVGDWALKNHDLFYKAPIEASGKKVAIVGSGPAGLSAAFYLRAAGNAVVVYDSKEEPGGMLMYAIPDYRMPKDIVREYVAALKGMGIEFICTTQVGRDILGSELEEKYDAVYYATGTWKRPVLGLAGEELTVFGLDFLVQVHDWMGGKVGSEVLVTGGGNVAMDVAITARRLGAKKVVLACLETEDIMPAGKEEVARAREEGVEVMPGWGLSKVIDKDGKVAGMELKRCLSVFDENHRFNPVYDEDDKIVVEAENILMAVGQQVDLNFLDEKYQLQLTNRGLIDVSEDTQMTSREGVFAAGDVTTGPSTVIECVANGHAAARGINRYLSVDDSHVCIGMQTAQPFLNFDAEGVTVEASLKLSEVPLEQRSIDIEDEIAPDWDAALAEAKRCMNCGCYAVAPSDIAPVLVALDASIHTTERTISAEEFFCSDLKVEEVLKEGELVTEVVIPILDGARTAYDKFRLREALDWAIVGLASAFAVEGGKVAAARLVLGGVAPVPVRLREVEGFLLGRELSEEVIEQAGELAVRDCFALWNNAYKVHEAKVMVEQALERLVD
jgi:NADPH-dependent glutamate synthase beta subunit-like oxidoreductase